MIQELENAVETSARSLGLSFTAPDNRKYGWGKKSLGLSVVDAQGRPYWLKAFGRPVGTAEGKLWSGELEAAALPAGIHKPHIITKTEGTSGEVIWCVLQMTYIAEPMASVTPLLSPASSLSSRWLDSLHKSLQLLSVQPTDRVGIRQDLVTRRIHEYFGTDVDAQILRWVCGHNDLHFANISADTACLLDWESWGLVPEGFDAAWLYCHSLANPAAAQAVKEKFLPVLETPTGRQVLLFAVAEMLRKHELHGEYAEIQPQLLRVASALR